MKGIAGVLGDDIAGGGAVGSFRFQYIAEGVDGATQRGRRRLRSAFGPEQVDQPVGGNGARSFRDQNF